ncbi:hypothetical protein HAZT_HAZT002545 [Hyalella azteca]|uniref:Uncharacterized protein n=1 Tax=Hyalella azteca TaxID=294128 RepID=A0A6A0H366_HYAAZ|nr:hypothetical protein HAZT_HAZT002545 [Hyalella azteca]
MLKSSSHSHVLFLVLILLVGVTWCLPSSVGPKLAENHQTIFPTAPRTEDPFNKPIEYARTLSAPDPGLRTQAESENTREIRDAKLEGISQSRAEQTNMAEVENMKFYSSVRGSREASIKKALDDVVMNTIVPEGSTDQQLNTASEIYGSSSTLSLTSQASNVDVSTTGEDVFISSEYLMDTRLPSKEMIDVSVPRNFTIGYLTGSERLPDDQEYKRPGLLISGALTLALDEINSKHPLINSKHPLVGGHRLTMQVAETYGRERHSILQTARLWTSNISVYIGPQETCVHEARMAAAFGLPMISYVSLSLL